MAHHRNSIACHAHSVAAFKNLVERVSGTRTGSARGEQIGYLGRYLDNLGTRTLVAESHYVDRNFMEEFGRYYSKCLFRCDNFCSRLHAFSIRISNEDFDEILMGASANGVDAAARELQAAYLGFVVVRPIPSVPIGRTVLTPLDGGKREFRTTVEQTIHLAGIPLRLQGLAFQQQDTAVAACASTAVWSALQRACRIDGQRAPTTSVITEAAARYFIPGGRAFPSSGLRVEQICDAMRAFDCAPIVLAASRDATIFRLLVNVYLRSGIPFVTGTDNHAVTVVGYRRDGPALGPLGSQQVRLHNLEYDQIYLHDDRLGPYARARFVPASPQGNLLIDIDLPGGGSERSPVTVAIVPLYPKLRTRALELLENVGVLLPTVVQAQNQAGRAAEQLGLEMFFERSGDYQASLYESGLPPQRLASFQRTVALSRYVAIGRWTLDGEHFVDSIWDTTDRIRSNAPGHQHLIGLVPYDAGAFNVVHAVANQIGKIAV